LANLTNLLALLTCFLYFISLLSSELSFHFLQRVTKRHVVHPFCKNRLQFWKFGLLLLSSSSSSSSHKFRIQQM